MSTNTPDQQVTIPSGTDLANNPLAFTDMIADVETRLVLKYTDVADRTARHTAPVENDLTGLATENRYDVYNGAAYVSLGARSNHFFVRRTSDGTPGSGAVNNNIVLQNEPVLLGAVDTGATYMWEAGIFYDSSTTADIRIAFTTPTFSAMRWAATGLATTAATNEGDVKIVTVNASGTSTSLGGIGVGTIIFAKIEGYIVTTAAGNIQFQFAQHNLDATQTTIRNGSYLRAWRMA
jgi:hypothetical protein